MLTLTVNTTSVKTNGSLLFKVTEFNLAPDTVNISAADAWFLPGLDNFGACKSGWTPYGVEIFRGHYTLQNLTSGANVLVFKDEVLPPICISPPGAPPGLPPTAVSVKSGAQFPLPLQEEFGSDSVYAVNGNLIPGYCQDVVNGTSTPTQCQAAVNSLESDRAAVYTFVAGDEWGDLVILNFAVVL